MPGLWPGLRVAVAVAVVAALVWRLGTGAVLDGLRGIGIGSVLAALAIGVLTTVSSAWRWCLVARGLGLRLPLGVAVADYYRASLLNSVLPAGILGDVHRAVRHGRQVGDLGRGVRAVVLERLAGNVVLVVVGGAVLLTQPTLLAAARDLLPGAGPAAEMLGVVAVVLAIATCALRRDRAPRIRRALRAALADARAGVFARGAWPGVVLLSAAALAGYLALFVMATRASGSQAGLGELLPLLLVALLAMGLPLGVGGWGPREAAAALAFAAVGFGAAEGLAASVVYGVLSLIACLPGLGVLLLWRPDRQLPAPVGRTARGGTPGEGRRCRTGRRGATTSVVGC